MGRYKPGYQMCLEEVQKFIDCTRESGYPPFKSIIISGGEPLLWKHLEAGVRMLRESGLSERLNIFSNGLNTQAITPELLNNITTLRLSKYANNQGVLADLVERFGTDHINVVDRTKHTPIPTEALDRVLPAKCGCEGYALCDRVMYACPMVPTVAYELELDLQDYPETYCYLYQRPDWVEALADFHRADHLLCRACIGNHRVRAQQAKAAMSVSVNLAKAEAKLNLLEFQRAMVRAQIPFYLIAGTLLGAYREGDFIDGDEKDIDVAVMERHFARIDDIHQSLTDAEFVRSKVFTVKDKVEGVTWQRGSNHIDIACMHLKDGRAYHLGRSAGQHGLPRVFACVYPGRCFTFASLCIEFLGQEFIIPNDPELFLSANYGTWKTPIAPKDFDYLDIKHRPCIDVTGWWEEE